MTESSVRMPGQWRLGIHPRATGMRVHSLGRVELPIGEALRLEMAGLDAGGQDVAHVQYHISTDAGGWALWISCARAELAGREAALQSLEFPLGDA